MRPLNHIAQIWPVLLLAAGLVLLASVVASLCFGALTFTPTDLWAWLTGRADAQTQLILGQLRLPRTLLAALVGGLLAICGTATQGLFRNSLADPSLIGVSAGAAAGASVAIVLLRDVQWSLWGLSLVSLGAFAGGLLVVLLVYRLARGASGTSVVTMLLGGMAFTFLAGAFTSLLEFMADNDMLRRMSLWRMGGLDGADFVRVGLLAVVTTGIAALLLRQRQALNALLLGESEARHLGVDVQCLQRRVIVCVALGMGVAVATAGTIAFIGLVVPHMVRMLVGPDHRYVLPLSGCVGAILLVLADTFARSVMAPTELPVGLVTAFIGAPVFISLLRQRRYLGIGS
ncbi:MAG: iron ABC transporter permease [Cellvibrionaceae bacterium]|nr:iron ABC transporter permease [Cellvibrionaceae bacterium]